jgi:hypothetical protein
MAEEKHPTGEYKYKDASIISCDTLLASQPGETHADTP